MLRRHQHHGDPREPAVVDTDRGSHDAPAAERREAPVRGEGHQHAPVLGPLIPTGGRTERKRVIDVGVQERSDSDTAHLRHGFVGHASAHRIAGSSLHPPLQLMLM